MTDYISAYTGEEIDAGIAKANTALQSYEYLNSVIEQAFDEITDEDTEITLNNTIQAKMKMELKGNTEQNGTPTPDVPVDVKVVTGDNTIKVEGKNLCNNNYLNLALNYLNNEIISDASSRTMYAKVPKNTDITISKTNVTNRFRVGLLNKIPEAQDTFYLAYINDDSSTLTTTINTGNYEYVAVQYTNQSQNTNLMIEKGSTASAYEEYQSQSYSLNLGDIELCKIGTYQDYIYKENNKWYKHSEIGKIVLDGSEYWTRRTFPDSSYLSIKMTLDVGVGGGFCNYFICNNNYDVAIEHMTISRLWRELCFAILKSRLSTGDEAGFKTWLTTHNTIVYYVLATPTNEEITDTTLISQLNAIENAMSYKIQTNISQTNANLSFILYASALGKLSS